MDEIGGKWKGLKRRRGEDSGNGRNRRGMERIKEKEGRR